jgi:hypothetical protein
MDKQVFLINFVKEFNLARLSVDADGNDEVRGLTMEDINGYIKRNGTV